MGGRRAARRLQLRRQGGRLAQRVHGEIHDTTLGMRINYIRALYKDDRATLDDFRDAVTTLEDATPTARRVLGGTHPTVLHVEQTLRSARAVLHARETLESA